MVLLRDVILKFKRGVGLFGTCSGFFGMVEAQGRGTLHCHMLVWIAGNPSPSVLRQRIVEDDQFKARMFTWLEKMISCEFPGQTAVTVEANGALPMPRLARDAIDPRSTPGPQVRDYRHVAEFWDAFRLHVSALVERCNWHEHKMTCWKHLKRGEEPSDEKCRMRIDGSTRSCTDIDPETGSIRLRRLHPRINEYNPVIMFLLKCNMDIQYVGSGEEAKAALFYITDYITKPTLRAHVGISALAFAIQKNNEKYETADTDMSAEEARSLVNKMVNQMMSRQEVSHQQIMSYYVGEGDCYTSHKFRCLTWGSFDRYVS
ncbi:hypothetical protein CALVIDRAFT_489496, partial [Calocera viscosa TUFC12733]